MDIGNTYVNCLLFNCLHDSMFHDLDILHVVLKLFHLHPLHNKINHAGDQSYFK